MTNLSIIIPHYNSTNSLTRLLNSIPLEKEIQILVIDDFSEEEEKKRLLEIKKTCKHDNIQFLYNDTDKKGAGVCRNIGLKYAKGRWTIFADADDYFTGDFYRILENYFDSSSEVIFFKPISIEIESGNISDRHIPFADLIDNYTKNKNSKTETLLRYRFVVPWSKMIRSEFIVNNNIAFDEVITANDVMFSTKLGHYMEKFEVSNEVIYCVTKSKGSLTTTITKKNFYTRMNVFIRYYYFLNKNLEYEDFSSLGLTGRGYLLNSMSLGFKEFINVYLTLKRNRIPIFDKKILNPLTFFKKCLNYYRYYKKQKNFEVIKKS